MPRASRMCHVSTCPHAVRPGSPCPVHGERQAFAGYRRPDDPEQRRLRRQVVGYRDARGAWHDGEELVCARCGGPGLPTDQLGHKVAISRGGVTVRANVQREHADCNLADGRALGRETLRARARA